jgi:hypothetical protein
MTTFFRVPQSDDKEAALRAAIDCNNSEESRPDVLHVDPVSFEKVPGSPYVTS